MYLPPEAANPYAERDHRQDDVFAFGVTWYQVLVSKIERTSYTHRRSISWKHSPMSGAASAAS
jgi:hypothetical protein